MKPSPLARRFVLVGTIALAASLCISTSAFAQDKERAVARPRAETPTTTRAGERTPSTPSKGDRTASTASTGTTTGTATTGGGRTRDGRESEGTAVPRTTERPRPTDGHGGYYGIPIGGYLGYGGYYGGYYDPGYSGEAPPPPPPPARYEEGAIKLKITPKQALVYVDGYFAGVVDDFDGLFQKLHVEAGRHHMLVQAEGYEPLEFDVDIAPDQTITYRGDLKKM